MYPASVSIAKWDVESKDPLLSLEIFAVRNNLASISASSLNRFKTVDLTSLFSFV